LRMRMRKKRVRTTDLVILAAGPTLGGRGTMEEVLNLH
jgi:hypothetical protein